MEIIFEDGTNFKYLSFNNDEIKLLIKFNDNKLRRNKFIFYTDLYNLSNLQNQIFKYINNSEYIFKNINIFSEIKYYNKYYYLYIKYKNNNIIFYIKSKEKVLFSFYLTENDIHNLYSFIKNIRIYIYENYNINTNELEL